MTLSVILTAQMTEVSCVVLALMWSIVVLPPLLYFSAVKTIQTAVQMGFFNWGGRQHRLISCAELLTDDCRLTYESGGDGLGSL